MKHNRKFMRRLASSVLLLSMAAGGMNAAAQEVPAGFENFSEPTVYARYNAPINGYDVKVMILPGYRTWRGSCRAIISLDNGEDSYKIVDDGWPESKYFDEDTQTLHMPDNKVITLNYNEPQIPARGEFTLEEFANLPFFFYDIDFDGRKDFVLNLTKQGQRWKNAYEVVQLEPDRLYSIFRKAPYTDLDDMTIIDPRNKTVTINQIEGAGQEVHTVYKVEEDDSMVVPKVTKLYTDELYYSGRGDDTRPVSRRTYIREQKEAGEWKPIR